ncbi:hypothetical protein MCOR23_002183 [Pyricularia oryzae]|nr:hypothetical protein MCOR19_001571 [Pyricularia oryzae]KAI6406561.1 hypothetical protein MCOR23_002183 [Pyricularia oryzae]KAI6447025.1 hypothetical protein MCOR15_010303 [Pyricularia oryzae]KAI6628670.1 hypothetical protein MCOR08_006653 [Pyricularia oryzae]
MWLINTTTFKREFRQPESSRIGARVKRLASNRSRSTPACLLIQMPTQAWPHGPHDQSARYVSACQVQRHPIPYVWVDTCCIDKTSSAELSEAINSMFRWYEMGEVCFVYLLDLDSTANEQFGQEQFQLPDRHDNDFCPSPREFWPCIDLQPLRSPLLPNSNLRTTDKESQTLARALGTVLGVKSSSGHPGKSGSGTQVLYRHTAEGGSAGERVSGVVCKVG